MRPDDLSHSDRPVSLSDLLSLISRKKWLIALCGIIGAALLSFWATTRPIHYRAEASFQEKGVQGSAGPGVSGFLGLLSGNLGSRPDNTIPLMKSRLLLGPLVKQYNLQATISEVLPRSHIPQNLDNNLKLEWSYLTRKRTSPIPDAQHLLVASEIDYAGEAPLNRLVKFTTDNSYTINDPTNGHPPLQGTLGHQIEGQGYSIQLQSTGIAPLAGRSFSLSLEPLDSAAKGLANRLDIKPDEKSDKILRLRFTYPDRFLSSQLLNSLMDIYQQYLKTDHQTLAAAQLAYLEGRRQDSANNLKVLITDYAINLSEDLATSGIIDSEKELERLEKEKTECRHRLLLIELELNRLQSPHAEESGYLSTLGASRQLPDLVQATISTINELKQRRDRLALALRKGADGDQNSTQRQLADKITDLRQIRNDLEQIAQLQTSLETNQPLPAPDKLAITSSLLLKVWYAKLWEAHERLRHDKSSQAVASYNELRSQFLIYLVNNVSLAKVHQRLIQERLALEQNPGPEMQGVDLPTTNNIYVGLTSHLHDTQAEIRQNSFIIDQVQDPAFEISALSGTLKDPVSLQLINHYSNASMLLKDSTIRSSKEQERIKEELAHDRTFLLFHLQQANQLLVLREDFLKTKIRSIQEVMLDLIQQQVSVSEKHLQDYTQAHIEQIVQEREFLQQTLRDINQQMSSLPGRWVSEQMIKHQSMINGAIVEEVSKLVETKNISHHLETVQSAPLDRATAPVMPARPNILLYALLGLFLGSGIAATWQICRGIAGGIEASEANLSLAKQYVAGKMLSIKKQKYLNPQTDHKQLATLRRLAGHLCHHENIEPESNVLLLLLGRGADYSQSLATLLSKKGHRVLHMELSFDRDADTSHLPGLLQVVEGSATEPSITTGPNFDTICAGGRSVHGPEFLHSRRFHHLLKQLSERYDWIVAAKRVRATSAEAESLSKGFSRIAITLTQEKLSDLDHYIKRVDAGVARIAFLFAQKP